MQLARSLSIGPEIDTHYGVGIYVSHKMEFWKSWFCILRFKCPHLLMFICFPSNLSLVFAGWPRSIA